MIANERQYRITQSTIRRLQENLATTESRAPSPNVHPKIHTAMQEGVRSQLAELEEQIVEYERLRAGEVRDREFGNISEVAQGLIEARIAAGLSQKGLAELLEIPEQQLQRYEATNYSSTSFRRIQEIAVVLGINVESHFHYAPASQKLRAQINGYSEKEDQFLATSAA